jgi:hypothetical protein
MSARPRVATKPLVVSTALLCAGCASLAAAKQGDSTIFQSDGGGQIVISRTSLALDGVSYPLQDCSDAAARCLSGPLGFHAAFPRRCPQSSWFPSEGAMKWSSGFPHSMGGRYLNRSGSGFLYDWDRKQGLVSLAYDPGKNFAALPPNYTHEGPTVYYRKSGPRLLACR